VILVGRTPRSARVPLDPLFLQADEASAAEPSTHIRYTRLFVADMAWITDRVRGLIRTRQSAGPAALEQIREWHPRFANSTDKEILQVPFSEDDARLVYAREHGFDTWADLTNRVDVLAERKDAASAEPFLVAYESLQSGDVSKLQALLQAHPGLARERGTNGNTLLNLAVSIAAKAGRNVGLSMIEALLDAGADVNEGNDRGWTPLHAAAYSNQSDIAAALIRNGASLDAEALAALFWGHREVSDLIGSYGVAPKNLRAAAGLGNLELLETFFSDERTLLPEAGAAGGFYRPHSGFPDWQPSNDPQEILDEAFGLRRATAWLCWIACCEVVPTSMPIRIAGPHSFGPRPAIARKPPHGCWIMAPM